MKARLAGLLSSLLPVVVIYASILALVPYGRLLSESLYRLWPEGVSEDRVLPVPGTSLAALPTGTGVCAQDGALWWVPDRGEPVEVSLPAPCGRLGFAKMTSVLAVPLVGRAELALVEVEAEGGPAVRLRSTDAEVTASLAVGRRVVVGTASGTVQVWDAGRRSSSVQVGSGPVADVHPSGDTVLVGIGEDLVQVGTDGGRVRVLHRIALGAPVRGVSRVKDRVHVATDAQVVSLRVPPDGGVPPRILGRRAHDARPTRIHTFLSSASVMVTEGQGAWILREDGGGFIWWGRRAGPRMAAVDCNGGWGQVRCLTADGHLQDLERYPSREALIIGVGVLGVLCVVGLLVVVVAGRRGALVRRVAVSLAALGALGWVLSGTYRSPIESLHVLEYGAIGALTFRALTRELGGGWTAALATVVIGFGLGLGDEAFQAVSPSRTGSMEDVLLDTQAVAIGTVLAWGGLGLGEGRPRLPAWPVPALAAVLVLCSAFFLTFAQGFADTYTEGRLTWISRLTPEETAARDADPGPAATLQRGVLMDYADYLRVFADEPFLYEVRVRLFRRDKRLERGDLQVACDEQQVLQRLFPRTVAATSFAWSEAQQAACARTSPGPYHSPVGGDRITWASPVTLWTGTIGLVLAGLIGAFMLARRRRPEPSSATPSPD